MKETAVEWLVEQIFNDVDLKDSILKLAIQQAKAMEREQMIYIIKTYHNNLFYLPLSENGEADRILDLILTKQIKPKL
jgi:hypothetical protein